MKLICSNSNKLAEEVQATVLRIAQSPEPGRFYEAEIVAESLYARVTIGITPGLATHPPDIVPGTPVSIKYWNHANELSGTARWDTINILRNPVNLGHLPESRLPHYRAPFDVDQLIQSCPFVPLRQFALNVLGNPAIGCRFFSIPASKDHHHCEQGGLAAHSLEVAKCTLASTSGYPEHERWTATMAGLFHDIGKICLYDPGDSSKLIARPYLPDAPTFELLGSELQQLESDWRDGADSVRYILDWLIKSGSRPIASKLAIAHAVKNADILSAARCNRERVFSGKPDWQKYACHKGTGAAPSYSYWRPGI